MDVEGLEGADVITAGFPCQDLSFAGKGAGLAGERSGLWWQVRRAIRVVRPSLALLENVAALLNRGMGTVCGSMAALGYDAEWHCVQASRVGLGHGRDRVWIVAYPASKGWTGILYRFLAEREIQARQAATIALDTSRSFDKRARGDSEGEPPLLPRDVRRAHIVDGLRATGNSMTHLIPEIIGHAILAAEAA
jgi:DNA (cytosine-5)-methyltransferase 1